MLGKNIYGSQEGKQILESSNWNGGEKSSQTALTVFNWI